jgi:hypothetical protein
MMVGRARRDERQVEHLVEEQNFDIAISIDCSQPRARWQWCHQILYLQNHAGAEAEDWRPRAGILWLLRKPGWGREGRVIGSPTIKTCYL